MLILLHSGLFDNIPLLWVLSPSHFGTSALRLFNNISYSFMALVGTTAVSLQNVLDDDIQ
jgi:hypothetical protein